MPRDEPALKDQDVNHHANDHTPDERSEEITAGFPAGFVGEFDASAATGTEAGEWAVEELPTDSALLVVTRGPNAGSRFLLDQPITSAGRHPGSDIFLDDITVSRRHAEFRRDDGQFQIVDIGKRSRISSLSAASSTRNRLIAYCISRGSATPVTRSKRNMVRLGWNGATTK